MNKIYNEEGLRVVEKGGRVVCGKGGREKGQVYDGGKRVKGEGKGETGRRGKHG
jgi:hypothetical protein